MNTLNQLKNIREQELFLFSGTPEIPEPVYEREIHPIGPCRIIKNKKTIQDQITDEHEEWQKIARIRIDFETKKIKSKSIRASGENNNE